MKVTGVVTCWINVQARNSRHKESFAIFKNGSVGFIGVSNKNEGYPK